MPKCNVGDVIVVEISSMNANLHRPSGLYLHTNPSFVHNLPYTAIYPDGFYTMHAPELDVDRRDVMNDLGHWLAAIARTTAPAKVILMGHLYDDSDRMGYRRRMNNAIHASALSLELPFVDTRPLVLAHGFAQVDGREDIHHLPSSGEDELARQLFNVASNI